MNISASGQTWVTPGFVVQMRVREAQETNPNPTQKFRIGYTVSRKVGSAVARNRIKRRLRAAVTKVFYSCTGPDRDYVFIGRRNAYHRPFKSLVSDMKRALQKLDARLDIPTK